MSGEKWSVQGRVDRLSQEDLLRGHRVPGAGRRVKDDTSAFGPSGWYTARDAAEEKQTRRRENGELGFDPSGWSGLFLLQMESTHKPWVQGQGSARGIRTWQHRHLEDFTSWDLPGQPGSERGRRRHKAQRTREEAFPRGNARVSNTAQKG